MTNTATLPKEKICGQTKEKETVKLKISDLPYIFIAGGLLGTVYEVILTLVTKGILEDRSGSIFTPFNYVYGAGAVVMVLLLYRVKNPIKVFVYGSLLGGIVEFGLSLGQELLLGSTSWDYSTKVMNIDGRTTVPYMLVWGFLCLVCVKVVFPMMLRLIHKIPERMRKTGAIVIVAVMSVDMLLSGLAVIRYSARASGAVTENPVLLFIDRVFDDSFMSVHYPNMNLK